MGGEMGKGGDENLDNHDDNFIDIFLIYGFFSQKVKGSNSTLNYCNWSD